MEKMERLGKQVWIALQVDLERTWSPEIWIDRSKHQDKNMMEHGK